MYIAEVPNRASPPAFLLRESYREDGKVRTRTLANLSSLTTQQREGVRCALRGETVFAGGGGIEKIRDRSHGAVAAVELAVRKLGLGRIIDRCASRERNLVMALLISRIVDAESKLATTRTWQSTTVPEDRDIVDATEDDVYAAMDWLFERQDEIEKSLAKRHLRNDGLVLYDLSSSYFEGRTCPLAKLGHNRDGKKGKLQVNYGLLTDERGCPIAVSVYEGNTSDSTTLVEQAERVQDTFGIDTMVLVGDRGMISQKQISALRNRKGVAWITALKSGQIRTLIRDGAIQLGLFDDRDLCPVEHAAFPGERLIACKNHELAKLRAYKRKSLIDATYKELLAIQGILERGHNKKLRGKGMIGLRVGKVINKYKVAKHFALEFTDTGFEFQIREDRVTAEAALDGLYVIRTPLAKQRTSDEQVVRDYKKLSNVERAFRSMKTIDLHVRPIHHRLECRVRAHIFLCMLAYYVEWHMREAWRSVTFADEDLDAKTARKPVAPAQRSTNALAKVHSKHLQDGSRAHSFRTLLADLGTITRSTFAPVGTTDSRHAFTMLTVHTVAQQQAFDLLKSIAV